MAFDEKDELKKINILIDLKGVRISTVSAILSVINLEKHPIIDVRCIQSLTDLGIIN